MTRSVGPNVPPDEAWQAHALFALGAAVLVLDPESFVVGASRAALDLLDAGDGFQVVPRIGDLLSGGLPPLRRVGQPREKIALRIAKTGRTIDGWLFAVEGVDERFLFLEARVRLGDSSPGLLEDPRVRARADSNRMSADSDLGELLPPLLHELRNPLAGMTTAVELLLEEAGSPEMAKDLDAILRAARRLDLLLFALGVLGRGRAQSVSSGAKRTLDEAAKAAVALAKQEGVVVFAEVSDVPPTNLEPRVLKGLLLALALYALSKSKAGDKIELVVSAGERLELLVRHRGSAGLIPAGGRERLPPVLTLGKRVAEGLGGGISAITDPEGRAELRLWLPWS